MPIIAFWSNNEKAKGQTVSAATAATVMALEHNYKILLMSIDFNNKTLENCFGLQESNQEIIKSLVKVKQINLESGINGILKLAESNRISPELIKDYTKIVFNNRLEILYSPMNIDESNRQEQIMYMKKYKNVILNAARFYDYVILDVKKGIQSEPHMDILNIADVVVVNCSQEMKEIMNATKTSYVSQYSNKILWNICRYDPESKYSLKYVLRNILKSQKVYIVPYNTMLFDSAQTGEVSELLIKFRALKIKDGENYTFYSQMKEFVDGIITKYREVQIKK